MSNGDGVTGGGRFATVVSVAVVLVILLGVGRCAYYKRFAPGDPPAPPPVYAGDPVAVTAATLVESARSNEAELRKRFGQGPIDVHGVVPGSGRSWGGDPYVHLEIRTDSLDNVSCAFRRDRAGLLKNVRRGDDIVIRGMLEMSGVGGKNDDGSSSYTVWLKDCSIVVNGVAR